MYARQPKERSSTSPNQGLRKFGLELRAEAGVGIVALERDVSPNRGSEA